MWALCHPAEAARGGRPAGRWSAARPLAAACLVAGVGAGTGALPAEVSAVIGVAAVHGGLIAIALIAGGVGVARAGVPIVILAVARAGMAAHPLAALAYLGVPLWLGRLAAAGALSRLGLGLPWPWGAVGIGALAGATLALHLFACASRTLGYGVHFHAAVFVPAVAYDLGANILSAEFFFRGALLQDLWRRWSFGLALAGASTAATLRYCVDPFVATTELRVGAAVYMALLAILNGVLYRWSGSLAPGLASGAMFFACYRLLATG